jgi:hypothetical protein
MHTRLRKGAAWVLPPALSGSLWRASQMLARSLEPVFAWRRVAGSRERHRRRCGREAIAFAAAQHLCWRLLCSEPAMARSRCVETRWSRPAFMLARACEAMDLQ